MKLITTYNLFEDTDDPVDMKRKRRDRKLLLIYLIFFFAFLVWAFMGSSVSNYQKYDGTELSYEIEGSKIDTFYGFSKYEGDVLRVYENKITRDGITEKSVTVFYKESIPSRHRDGYKENVLDNGYSAYTKNDGSVIYVKNTENRDSFMYIVIDDIQMKYAVCYPGRYQDVLEFTGT